MSNISSWLGFLTLAILIWQVIVLRGQVKTQEKTIAKDHERRKKQAAFMAMNILRSDSLDHLERKARQQVNSHTDWAKVPDELRANVRDVLSHFERFAVAVNTEVYDLHIVDRTMGQYLIGLWRDYSPYIKHVREIDKNGSRYYCDFEALVSRITVRREDKTVQNAIVIKSSSFNDGVIKP